MKYLKAISIYGEYVQAILNGTKTEEYRSWKTKYRGDILICTTATKERFGYTACVVELYDMGKRLRITDRMLPFSKPEFYAWKLRNVRKCVPVPIKGQQMFYNVSDDKIVLLSSYPAEERESVYLAGLESCKK
jgi:hypothetical protein